MHRCFRLASTAALLLVSVLASAQEKKNEPASRGVLQIGEIQIVGRVQKPIASVDVGKLQPKLTLAELRQPFLNRIEAAVVRDPF